MMLGHQVASGDLAEVIEKALDIGIHHLEQRKPRAQPRPANPESRYIAREVKVAVWKRDGGQCAFVGESGHRCECRTWLQFDHIVPLARGGTSTVENLRLLCSTHNQFAAERAFGSEFMKARIASRDPKASTA
jgi:5-methylcytosine-specific restriction endonuclease McrA